MLGTSIQLDRFHKRTYHTQTSLRSRKHEPSPFPTRTEPAGPAEPTPTKPTTNLGRFLDSTTPSVPAHYLPKMMMRELRPYFILGDLWDSFKEWSAYGAGVPLLLNENDCVVQYYVPYLSGMQLFGNSCLSALCSRLCGEESDGEVYRDSSSDGSSDCELIWDLKSKERGQSHLSAISILTTDRLSLRKNPAVLQEGFSSDDGEVGNSEGCLLFEYLEEDPPYCREPLADKISELASCFPELRVLRSCDLLPASWLSVAWYPIYRIPTGSTLKDLDACFLTFHSLSTPTRGAGSSPAVHITYPRGFDGVPRISLPAFGLASYKLRGSVWTISSHSESLLQAADSWLSLLGVHHPDYQFFVTNGACRR